MRVRVGVRTPDGGTSMKEGSFSPFQALEQANMFVILPGYHILYIDADTGEELTMAHLVKASVTGGAHA